MGYSLHHCTVISRHQMCWLMRISLQKLQMQGCPNYSRKHLHLPPMLSGIQSKPAPTCIFSYQLINQSPSLISTHRSESQVRVPPRHVPRQERRLQLRSLPSGAHICKGGRGIAIKRQHTSVGKSVLV